MVDKGTETPTTGEKVANLFAREDMAMENVMHFIESTDDGVFVGVDCF